MEIPLCFQSKGHSYGTEFCIITLVANLGSVGAPVGQKDTRVQDTLAAIRESIPERVKKFVTLKNIIIPRLREARTAMSPAPRQSRTSSGKKRKTPDNEITVEGEQRISVGTYLDCIYIDYAPIFPDFNERHAHVKDSKIAGQHRKVTLRQVRWRTKARYARLHAIWPYPPLPPTSIGCLVAPGHDRRPLDSRHEPLRLAELAFCLGLTAKQYMIAWSR